MISIELANESAAFLPDSTIEGTVRWSEEQGTSLEVRLIWFTQGKGDRDFDLVDVHKVASFGPSGSEQFQFNAPSRPQSFSGKLIALQWAIEAIAFPDESTARKDLTISSNGREISLMSHPLDS
jgi:hypothetical protein